MKENGIYKYNDMNYNTYNLENGTLLIYEGRDGDLLFFSRLENDDMNSVCLGLEEVIYFKSWNKYRLDKVLAKFGCELYEDNDKECLLSLNKNFGLSIQFDNYGKDNVFTLCGDMGQDNTNYIEISLNTVESLIKDMEENNGNLLQTK